MAPQGSRQEDSELPGASYAHFQMFDVYPLHVVRPSIIDIETIIMDVLLGFCAQYVVS
jgi:hypothetical protein